MNRQTFGRIGEDLAEEYLHSKGYRTVTVRYRADGGEIDLIMLRRGVLVFAEVKTKSGVERGAPASHFTPGKAAALRRAARFFLRTAGAGGRVRAGFLGVPSYRRYKKTRFDLLELLVRDGKVKRLIHTKDVIGTENRICCTAVPEETTAEEAPPML